MIRPTTMKILLVAAVKNFIYVWLCSIKKWSVTSSTSGPEKVRGCWLQTHELMGEWSSTVKRKHVTSNIYDAPPATLLPPIALLD